VLSRQSRPQQTFWFVFLAILALGLFSAPLAGIRFHQEEFFMPMRANRVVLTVPRCDAPLKIHSAAADPAALAAASHGRAMADLYPAADSGSHQTRHCRLPFSDSGADFNVPIPTKSIIFSVRDSGRGLDLILQCRGEHANLQ
jgi:hypothetical protein